VFDALSAATGDGEPLALEENQVAQDPTWAQLRQFLLYDDTDEREYLEGAFVCTDFAAMLHDRAEAESIRAAYVSVRFAAGPGHALNAFDTVDKGLVFVDCTGQGLSVATPGGIAGGGPSSYDKVAYLSIGSEYGLVSMDKATSFDYEFYEDWLRQWEEYDSRVDLYKSGQATPDELASLRSELEALEDVLGRYRWVSPGTVSDLYVHW
jgi:hypothetical protein